MRIRKILLSGIVLFFCLFFLSPVLAAEKSWNFEKWSVDIQINKDGTFVVKETQTFNFYGNFHWVKRDIAKQKLRKVTDVKVFDKNGRELKGGEIEIEENEKEVSIKLNFDLINVQKTWTFQYKVHGGLGYFEEHDELYWNAVSSEREVSIKEAEVFVHLPQSISLEDFQQELYIGLTGSKITSKHYKIIDADTLRYWGNDIRAFENFTIVAGWPRGIIEHGDVVKISSLPEAQVLIDGKRTGFRTPVVLEQGYEISSGQHQISVKKFGWQIKGEPSKTVLVGSGKIEKIDFVLEKTFWFIILGFLPFLIPLGLAVYIIRRWLKSPRVKKTVIAQYEPPDNLGPTEVGALIDFKIQPRDITAILIDLAYRGYLKIIEKEKKTLWIKGKKYFLEKKKEADGNLKDYEELLFNTIFSSKTLVEIDELKKEFSLKVVLKEIQKTVFRKLVDNRYFNRSPMGKLMIFLQVIAWIIVITSIVFRQILLGSVGLILYFGSRVLCVFLTPKGAEAKWYALGFKEYLRVAERFRLDACTPETFEKYLSYAIAFGVEKKWAKRFVDICKKPPDWFESSQPISTFTAVGFVNSISSMSQAVTSGVAGASPSGSSGFGGGGAAGGGGGGGGSSAG